MVVSSGPAPRTVPDLTGVPLADAVAQLEAMSLVVVQAPEAFSDTVPIGAVAGQDPPSGTSVPIGSTVTIAVSKGTELVTVPPLADLTLQQANDALIAAGLVLGRVEGDPGGINILPMSTVCPSAASAVLPRGTAIDLTFGQPPPPPTPPPDTTPTTLQLTPSHLPDTSFSIRSIVSSGD